MMGINWLAIVAAGFAGFIVGGLWYSPVLFGKAWQREVGLTEEQMKQGNMAKIMGGSLVLAIISAAVFSMFLGPKPDLAFATGVGFAAGLCWVAASFGINYLFERRSFKLFAINGGYHTLEFTLIGLVLALLG
jgi:hypothetical protein